MLKQFEGLKKRQFCVEVKKIFYQNNDVTTCVLDVLIPLGIKNYEINTIVEKKFPEAHIISNCARFVIKGISKPRGGDKYDEKKGKTIAYSKAQWKAYSITTRILDILTDYYSSKAIIYSRAAEFLDMATDREREFLDSL